MSEQYPDEADESEYASVKLWLKRIREAKTGSEKDFKRFRKNMEFAAGIQRPTQDTIDCEYYTANWINREVNQKVASLYARDPKAVYQRRKRLDYKLWDGSIATKVSAMASITAAGHLGMMPSPEAMMLIADIEEGDKWKKLVERVGDSMEKLYQYECDTQAPSFKFQMKQLVRRVVTTGVGYVRLNFSREADHVLSEDDSSLVMRIKRAQMLLGKMEDGSITNDDPRVQELQMLVSGIQTGADQGEIQERLEFDFPPSTSVIVDPRCRSLKGFAGARWIAQQYIVPLDFVNSYFEVNIPVGGELVHYAEDGVQKESSTQQTKDDPDYKPLCCLFEVFDHDTKCSIFLVDGYKCYVQPPAPVEPMTSRFWPIFSLTFNDVEVEPGLKVKIYPPSDIDLYMHAQKEWNRSREGLREHRQENAPFYVTKAGWLSEEDKANLSNHESGKVIELTGTPPDGDISKALVAFQPAPIDPAVYVTDPYEKDVGVTVGGQNMQNEQPNHVAATPAMIQEQNRNQGVSSNVDDLDDLLSELARASGEIMLKEFSPQTVERIVGRGAVWPDQNREDFLNEVYLDIEAASSGRPNKAADIANFERVMPLMLQAGANPWAIIQEGVKRLDDRLEASDFAPVAPVNPTPNAKPTPGGPTGQPAPKQPMPGNMANQPIPVPA